MENIFKKALSGIETADKEKKMLESFIAEAEKVAGITDELGTAKELKRRFVVDHLRAWLEARDIRHNDPRRSEVSERRLGMARNYRSETLETLMKEVAPTDENKRLRFHVISDNTPERTPRDTRQTDSEE